MDVGGCGGAVGISTAVSMPPFASNCCALTFNRFEYIYKKPKENMN